MGIEISHNSIKAPDWHLLMPQNNLITPTKNWHDAVLETIENVIKGKNNFTELVNNFSILGKSFPQLSLWERFKDFFGMSDTKNNQRHSFVLHIASLFYQMSESSPLTEAQQIIISTTIAEALHVAGYSANMSVPSLKTSIGMAFSGIMLSKPQLFFPFDVQLISVSESKDHNDIVLEGKLIFNNVDKNDVPEYFRKIQLPFQIYKPCNHEPLLYDYLQQDILLTTLVQHQKPQDLIKLQVNTLHGLLSTDDFSSPKDIYLFFPWLFPQKMDAYFINNSRDLQEQCAILNIENYKNDCSIILKNHVFTHIYSKIEKELIDDSYRGKLPAMTVIVNNTTITPLTLERMQNYAQRIVDTIQDTHNKIISNKTRLADICNYWTNEIQQDLKIDNSKASSVCAALIYSLYQGGAGKSNLCLTNPGKSSGRELESRTLNITLAQDNSTHVTLQEFSFLTDRQNPTDKRCDMGGIVTFELPTSTYTSANDIAVGYLSADIHVAGCGLRLSS